MTLSSITATVIGTGGVAPGYGSFTVPIGVAVLPNGNIVVADRNVHIIRLITPAGVVTTLAGTAGTSAFADGTGAAARFSSPNGVAVLPNGNIVVADTNNSRIRLVTQAGVVTTLAGSNASFADGTGTAARFNAPYGVAVLPDGNIVVADTTNNRIRLITPAGVVTTLAGNATGAFADGTGTAASFNNPYGVTVIPSSGVIVVGDFLNNRIRLVTPGGVVTTLAGQTTAGNADGTGASASFNGPWGVAVIPSSGVVVVADANNSRIRLVTQAGVVTTLAGSTAGFADGTGTAARFNSSAGVAVLPNGNIVVADPNNNRIRLVTQAGVVTTMAGGAAGSANGLGPTGPALLVAGSSVFAGPVNITNLLGNTGPIPNVPALEVDGDALVAGNMIVTAGAYSMPSTVAGSVYNTSGFTNALGSITGTNSGPIPADEATIYSFTSGSGTFVVPAGAPVIVDYLVVGGGGAGGNWIGGGGGAGGLVYAKGVQLPAGSYSWTVGAGGVGVTGCNVSAGNGSNSSLSNATFGNVVALGGGAGGTFNSTAASNAGSNGGSGGGGAQNGSTLNLGGVAAIGQGNSGGSCAITAFSGGGGGGGAGGLGTSTTTTAGGAGGIGLVIPITGSNVYYAGGGGGAADGAASTGGLGGGGAGIGLAASGAGVSGLANTGGGGGGAARNAATFAGGSGGSGVIILRVYTNIGSRLLIGDGSGYSMALSAQSNAVTTDVMTVTDQGNVSIGLSNALFNGITDGTFDSSGNMYICDTTNNRVRKISPTGIVTTLVGNGLASNVAGTGIRASLNGPSGLVLDTSGNMWVSTLFGQQIAKVVLSTLVVTFPLGTYGTAVVAAGTGATSTFASPRGLVHDSVNGFLWVAQAGVISRILVSTLTSTLLSNGPSGCLALAYDGTFLYASTSTTIQKITTPGGSATTATLYTLTYPWGLSLNSSKTTLYFSQLNGGPIGSAPVPTAGTVTILAGSNGVNGSTDATGRAASFSANVQGIFLDNLGSNIYITDFIVPKIRRLNIPSSNVTTYAGTSVAGFADGSVLTSTTVNNTLAATTVTAATMTVTGSYAGLLAGGNTFPINTWFNTSDGNLFLINFGGSNIFSCTEGSHKFSTNNGAAQVILSNGNITAASNITVNGNAQVGTQLNVGSSTGAALCIGSNTTSGSTGAIRITQASGLNYIQSGANFDGASAGAPLLFTTMNGGTEWARFASNGRFGIGTPTPGNPLSVLGTIETRSTTGGNLTLFNINNNSICSIVAPNAANNFVITVNAGGTATLANTASLTAWAFASDSNLKNIIRPVSNATDMLSTITPVYYSMKSDPTNTPHLGVLAQEVQKMFPEFVTEVIQATDTTPGYLGVSYGSFVTPLIAAVKELSARLSNVEARLAAAGTTGPTGTTESTGPTGPTGDSTS